MDGRADAARACCVPVLLPPPAACPLHVSGARFFLCARRTLLPLLLSRTVHVMRCLPRCLPAAVIVQADLYKSGVRRIALIKLMAQQQHPLSTRLTDSLEAAVDALGRLNILASVAADDALLQLTTCVAHTAPLLLPPAACS